MTRTDTTRVYHVLPAALPGFEHIKRYWDNQHQIFAAKIVQGEFYVSAHGEMITTVLGSCVSACIRDTALGIGGMNHFMLPRDVRRDADAEVTPVDTALRYGNVAMERLINCILGHGGSRRSLEVKLFGGGRLLDITTDIGRANIEFVRGYLKMEDLNIAAEDLGGDLPRKVNYNPVSGRARVKKLLRLHNDTLIQRELAYMTTLRTKPDVGSVDLF
jgi:chemotaxis protein CheD